MAELTTAQHFALERIHDEWNIPQGKGASAIHNGTLLALIRKGLIEWDGGAVVQLWDLNYGRFRRTEKGRMALGA